jgi:chromosomal replication initiator protein
MKIHRYSREIVGLEKKARKSAGESLNNENPVCYVPVPHMTPRRLGPRDPSAPLVQGTVQGTVPGTVPGTVRGKLSDAGPETVRASAGASEAAALLAATLARMSQRMSLFSFRGFLEPLTALTLETDALVLGAPSAFHRDWVRDHYGADLATEASRLLGRPLRVAVEVDALAAARAAEVEATDALERARELADENGEENDGQPGARPTSLTPRAAVVEVKHPNARVQRPARLSPRYTFETFVTGPSNRMAFAAATAVAERPGAQYSPLFLFGGTGLGKTHLLHAIGNEVLSRHPHLRVVYMSAEQWVNEYIAEIQERRFDEFRRRYRDDCDLLLIDDIQFLAGKNASQDEFFHTFNALYEAHKQIVVTSDRYPHEIAGLEERLKTRLQWGLVADVQPPEIETRLAILNNKAADLGCALPLDVSEYLATHVTSSIRELEGALVRLSAFSTITREPITLEQAKDQLRPVLSMKAHHVTVARVTEVVAAYYGLRVQDVKGPSRQRQITRARQIAMWLARQHLAMSLPEIGRAFGGRDHTTALASIDKIDGLLETDAGVQVVIKRLKQSLFGV